MENNKKIGMSTLKWILSITGIILLILLIILPPIFRIIFEEEYIVDNENSNKIEEIPSNKEEVEDNNYAKITCIKQTTYPEYIDNSIVVLAHDNNLLKVLTEDIPHTYLLDSKNSESMYTEEKLSCNSIDDSIYQITGFNYSCQATIDSIQTSKKYDLNKFEPTSVTTKDGEILEIKSSFILNQDIADITTSLTSEGYTCQ